MPCSAQRDTALAGDLSHGPKGEPPVILLAPGSGVAGQSVTWPGLVEWGHHQVGRGGREGRRAKFCGCDQRGGMR